MLTFPDHVRPELADYPAEPISSAPLRSVNSNWIESYFSAIGIEPATLADIESIILATHSSASDGNPCYRKTLRNEIRNTSGIVAVKYHPRETDGDYLGVAKHENTTILPQSIPAELVYLYANRLTTVVGTISTALLTARWIDDDLEVISLADVIDIGDDRLKTMFRSVDIDVRS
ncbi:hypothetical protein C495_08005 [Natronorubrum sulfidifaciens JCM 14089]|uniref:Uncharacterized protein n=1 Tax=Natronorubrum sulfidifaciens JCM 14089 TaxID=1230460 RepID=L9W7V7_9EURY|nr:hypothetical protein C495_08005 [Natronorubrum sulfidifaciens JCM 14089]